MLRLEFLEGVRAFISRVMLGADNEVELSDRAKWTVHAIALFGQLHAKRNTLPFPGKMDSVAIPFN